MISLVSLVGMGLVSTCELYILQGARRSCKIVVTLALNVAAKLTAVRSQPLVAAQHYKSARAEAQV